ncbi:MAG: PD-(D/E)XK nuclease family protein [Rubellimicrobium sp.]|nr:PD-(D/E)XK nuclease family protein [Rubellimicrobium sp.]
MSEEPRLFGLPPGVDFAAEVVRGLAARMQDAAPEDWARVEIWANTPRMARRLHEAFAAGPARLLPRLRLLSEVALPGQEAPVPPLRRRLDLARLVAALIARDPTLAARDSAFALADSLAALMDEMAGEGVPPDVIAALDVADQSGHWARALRFLAIAQDYAAGGGTDAEALRRNAVLILAERWSRTPPAHPVIVAGSTGSRGTTALFMAAVARLPQGAVILPGFDPAPVWADLDDATTAEDHPQFRFRRLADLAGVDPAAIRPWTDAAPPRPARNALVSLALRPAPVTDRWIAEGPALGPLPDACAGMILLEAPSPRIEAEAIAMRLRHAVTEGRRAALISPDRMLTRQVTAALDRWGILPDDSAGLPLGLSPPGRFLRQVADLMATPATGTALVALLKHPLCHSGADRGAHLLATQAFELRLRRQGPAWPDGATLRAVGGGDPWHEWLAAILDDLPPADERPLGDHVARHLALAERFAAGSTADARPAGTLWDEAAGREARARMEELRRHADAGGAMDGHDYAVILHEVIAAGQVRDRDAGHPLVRILGPREARECDADLVILGGLNEGVWPVLPQPDPWLNRTLRLRAGLLLPERQIGLSAHDFQQAIAAREVWLTRSTRSDSAETVPARWLARLTNLLSGLPAQGGPAALARMRAEGAGWIAGARALSQPEARVPPEPRPSPAPPPEMRPAKLSVTRVERLLRDPYAVYAQEVLRLSRLDPLTAEPDAPLRGTILHRVFESAFRGGFDPDAPDAALSLIRIAERVLTEECPWPMMRRLWLARMTRIADWFVEGERARRLVATPHLFEERGAALIPGTGVTLTVKADRIDLTPDGRAVIHDYKTGTPPTVKQQNVFDKQLLLTAALIEAGGIAALGPVTVAGATYIGVGSRPQIVEAPLADNPPAQVWRDLSRLMQAWADPARGYTARMAMTSDRREGDHDHLSRFGEWDPSAPATVQVMR